MVTITKFDAWSVAKVLGILYTILGLIFGIIIFLVSLIPGGEETDSITAMLGLGILIAFPVMYGVMGLVSGYVFTWLYNAVAKKFGGIRVEVKKGETAA